MKRVCITGIAGISCVGHTIEATWQAVQSQKQNFVTLENEMLTGITADNGYNELISDRKLLRIISEQNVLGLCVIKKAFESSGLLETQNLLSGDALYKFNNQIGIFVSSFGTMPENQHYFLPAMRHNGEAKFGEAIFKLIRPTESLRALPNNVLAHAAMIHGFKGYNQNFLNHQVGSLQAIGIAFQMIQQGAIDRAVVVGYDVPGNAHNLTYYDTFGLLSHADLLPYAKESQGTILAEGACALILESEKSALEQKATIYGEITGFATLNTPSFFAQSDRYQDTLSAFNQAYTSLSEQTRLSEDMLIVGNGCGIESLDRAEMAFIREQFDAKKTALAAFKPTIGNTRAASVPLELSLGLTALTENQLPKPPHLDKMDASIQSYFNTSLENIQDGLIMTANINGGGVGMLSFKRPIALKPAPKDKHEC